MKYIIFEDFAGEETPIIFPSRIGFEELREQIPYARVLAAGEVQLQQDKFVCQGQSRELNAASRPEDILVIASYFQKTG